MHKAQLLQKFRQFCNSLGPKDRVAILHHSDADGICSAAIASSAVEKLTGRKPAVLQHYEYGSARLLRNAIRQMRRKKTNVLLILDIGIDGAKHSIIGSCPFEKCLVIDHHRMLADLNSEKVLFLKAEFFTKKDSCSYVASKFAFDLFKSVAAIDEMDWVACVGILGDNSLKSWRPFVKKTLKKRNLQLTTLYRLQELIAAIEVLAPGRIGELVRLIQSAKEPAALLQTGMRKYLREFKKEKDALVSGFEKKAERFPEIGLFFFAIKARHGNIKSHVINEISELRPDKTIILLQHGSGNTVRFSARRQDAKVKMNELLREAVGGLPESSAGGHAPAAAGSTKKRFVERFKKNVVEILRKKYAK